MANPQRGEAGVVVGGKRYTLRPTFDSLCELEELTDKPFDQILAGVQQGRVSGLRAVLWCLLQDQHAKEFPALKDASAWIDKLGGVQKALEVVQEVMGANVDEEETAKASDPPIAQDAGTGEPLNATPVASV